MKEYREEFIVKMVTEKLLPRMNSCIRDFNQELKELLDDKPYVNVGDFVKDQHGDIYKVDSIVESKTINNLVYVKDKRWGSLELSMPSISYSDTFRYWLIKRLKSGKFSSSPRIYYGYEIIRMSVTDDLIKDFQKIENKDRDLLDLAYKVDEIISAIESGRYNAALNKYSKSANIPKKVVEKHPEIIELHQKIETLKSFQNSIQLPL